MICRPCQPSTPTSPPVVSSPWSRPLPRLSVCLSPLAKPSRSRLISNSCPNPSHPTPHDAQDWQSSFVDGCGGKAVLEKIWQLAQHVISGAVAVPLQVLILLEVTYNPGLPVGEPTVPRRKCPEQFVPSWRVTRWWLRELEPVLWLLPWGEDVGLGSGRLSVWCLGEASTPACCLPA